ncbi:MAG: aromatic amino acid ammonia-lyase [Planctomycetota bacterium]
MLYDTAIQARDSESIDDDAVVGFGPDAPQTCESIESLADRRTDATFTDRAVSAVDASRAALAEAHRRGDDIYGLTTGFGPHVCYSADSNAAAQGTDLIAHLTAGCGPYAERRVSRATLAVRSQTLAQGMSGVHLSVARAVLALLRHDVCPAIPTIGSVGASGDLIPLAHVARVLSGTGHVIDDAGRPACAADALSRAGLQPIALPGRDALAIVNGTAFMTAYAALALARADRLIRIAESLTAWAYRSLAARDQALDARLHAARGHAGQVQSASNIASELRGHAEDRSRPLQEVYSLRCAPQILGACRDQLSYARRTIEQELNGVNDNPVVCDSSDGPAVLHGGNFQGQQIAFAADAANAALTQAGLLIERQLAVVLDPQLNGGAPLLLAWQPGATSGIAGAQITATAVAAELRRSATPSAVATMPTNGRNQDIVSMGTMAARVFYEQTERCATILAVHGIALVQLEYLRSFDRAPGRRTTKPVWFPEVEGFQRDRPLHGDIERVARNMLAHDVLSPLHATTDHAP